MSVNPQKILSGGRNWRLRGLLAAHPDMGGNSAARELGKRWPVHKSDYRILSNGDDFDGRFSPERRYNPSVYGGVGEREMSEAKDFLDTSEYKKLESGEGVHIDRYIKRALLSDSETELDVLYRETLRDSVIRGAQPRQIARDVANVINVDTTKGDIPRGSSRIYAPSVARGAEIETDEENFDTVEFNCTKHALGFEVTDELIDQGVVDVIERQIEFTGAAVENAINRTFLNNLVDNAGNEFDTAGAGQDVSMVNNAVEEVEKADFAPTDTLVMHPEFKTALFEDSNLAYANQAGSDSVITDRTYNQLLGAELATASTGTYNSTSQTWGFGADGEIGAVVYNSDFVSIPMYQDLTVKDYEDPIRDLQGGNVRAQFDSIYHQPNAACRVEF